MNETSRARAAMLGDERLQRRRPDHRHVAVEDQHVAVEVRRESLQAASRRVARAALRGLTRDLDAHARHAGARGRRDLVALMADHHDQRRGRERHERAHHARDHRLAAKLVQHLGPRRAHPGAKPGGQNDRPRCRRHGFFFLNSASSCSRAARSGDGRDGAG